jgi:hypothetical protein
MTSWLELVTSLNSVTSEYFELASSPFLYIFGDFKAIQPISDFLTADVWKPFS